MEPTGIVLGAVVLVKPVITTVANIIKSERRFGSDTETLHLRFRAQQNRLEALERVLFQPRWQQKQDKVPVWTLLPESVQSDVVGMLHQLYLVLNDFVAVKSRYDLHFDPDQHKRATDGLVSSAGAVTISHRDTLIASGDAHAKKKRLSTQWLRRLWWATYEKKTVISLVEDFEIWNERLKQIIETVWWPLPFLSSIASLETVANDSDVSTAKLMDDVKIRKLLMPDAQPSNTEVMSTMRAERDDFKLLSLLYAFEIGTMKRDGKQWPVMVEFKQYGQNQDQSVDEADLQKIRHLAQLLNQQDDSRFRVFRCVALFNDVMHARYGLIFTIPEELQPKPTSLKDQLANNRTGRPPLEVRLRLAHALSESLLLLHSVGWVHQSFRCDNVLLFPPQNLATEDLSSGAILDKYEPQICGFEFSRAMDAYSYRHVGTEPWKNLYRHPDRWGQPSQTFSRHHDIYALGVVLLEIGLWERVDTMDRGTILAEANRYREMAPSNARDSITLEVQKRMLRHVNGRLGFYMGTQYQNAVRKCLDDTFKGKEPLAAQAAVARDVVGTLENLLDIADVQSTPAS